MRLNVGHSDYSQKAYFRKLLAKLKFIHAYQYFWGDNFQNNFEIIIVSLIIIMTVGYAVFHLFDSWCSVAESI